MLRFLCIRHAESTMNVEGRWQGQLDPPLSARGVAQARALAARLRARQPAGGFARLVSSDLRRARQTAACVGRALGLAPLWLPALREIDAGCWSGLFPEELARGWPRAFARYQSGDFEQHAGGGENRREVRARVWDALSALSAKSARAEAGQKRAHAQRGAVAEATALVITHGGVLSVLRPGLHIKNGEMCRVERHGRAWRVL